MLAVDALSDDKTLVTVTMSNRPFIVDSVLGELNNHRLDVELVTHPVTETQPGLMTSLVLVVMTGSRPATRKAIKSELKNVLQQVRLVTDDWRPMLLRVDEEMETFRTTPPPLPAERIAEAVQFLQWLTNNNFTFMGLREYSYIGNRKKGELKPVPGSALELACRRRRAARHSACAVADPSPSYLQSAWRVRRGRRTSGPGRRTLA